MIEVELPDGSIAEFPDGTPPDAMKKAIQKRFPPKMGVAEDMARSGATGVREGVEGLAGMAGDLREGVKGVAGEQMASLKDAVSYWLGNTATDAIGKTVTSAFPALGFMMSAPTSADIHSAVEPAVKAVGAEGILSHTPQTTAGEYSRTVGQFLPGAAVPGGGGVTARLAKNVLAPAIASETAGQITKGTDYEPLARVVGAVLGGGAANMVGAGNAATKAAAKGAPSAATLQQHTDDLYAALRSAGIRYDADEFTRMADDLPNVLKNKNVRPIGRLKEAYDWADEVGKLRGTSPDFDDINSLRSAIGEAARDASKSPEGQSLARALYIVKNQIDNFERGAPLVTNQPVPTPLLNKARDAARELALRNIKQRAIDDVVKKADTYEAGVDSGIRQGLGNLLRSKYGQKLFTDAERKALLDVKQGKKALRTLSKFGFDFSKLASGASFMPTMGAGAAGGLATMAGLPALPIVGTLATAGTLAKTALPRLTAGALDDAGAAIRSGRLNDPAFLARQPGRLSRAAPALLPGALAAQPFVPQR